MPGGYQSQVYNQPAQAVAGDRASQNPIATYPAGPGGLIADVAGVTVGAFAWAKPPTDPNGEYTIATQAGGIGGNVAGFVYNWTQGLNTVFLSDGSMLIPQGLPVALAIQGDFWVVNNGTTVATLGQKAYAAIGTGLASFAATGSPTTTSTATGSTIVAATFSVTGSIQNDILTVTAVASGTVVAGATISGTGITTGTQITGQISGTPGGVGVYTISPSQQRSIASQTVSGTYGTFTVGTMTLGTGFSVGQVLSGSGVAAGTTVTQLLTGTGGNGSTFAVNNNTAVGSTAISATGNVETKFVAASVGQPGQLVKITSWEGTLG
jgi:hypothetical protein